jgi:hypothetical protein
MAMLVGVLEWIAMPFKRGMGLTWLTTGPRIAMFLTVLLVILFPTTRGHLISSIHDFQPVIRMRLRKIYLFNLKWIRMINEVMSYSCERFY